LSREVTREQPSAERFLESLFLRAAGQAAHLTGTSLRQIDRVRPKHLLSQRAPIAIQGYDSIVAELIDLVESARRVSARPVNAVMTATYWEIGRRIVEFEH